MVEVGFHGRNAGTLVFGGRARPSFLIGGYCREKFAHPRVNREFPDRAIVADQFLYVRAIRGPSSSSS